MSQADEIKGAAQKKNLPTVQEALPQEVQLAESYLLADSVLMKKYLSNLSSYEVVPISASLQNLPVSDTIRFFHLNRIVYDKEENNQEKLLNVYHALYTCQGSVILLLKSNQSRVDFYIGTKADSREQVVTCQDVLHKAIKGNFPGTEMVRMRDQEMKDMVSGVFDCQEAKMKKSIAAITSIAGFREGHTMKSGDFVQGLEKLLETTRGEEYSLMVLAHPVSPTQLEIVRSGYENLYSQLLPFAATDVTYGENESDAVTKSVTQGLSTGITDSIAHTTSYSHAHSDTRSHSDTVGRSDTKGTSNTIGLAAFGGVNAGTNQGLAFVASIGSSVGSMLGGALSFNRTWSKSHTDSKSHTETKGVTDTHTTSNGDTTSRATTKTESETTGRSDTQTLGSSISYLTHMENRGVKTLLERIDTQLARLDECMDLGMWDAAAYVIADDARTSQVVASAYQALTRGKNSGVENSAVTVWSGDSSSDAISAYLRRMEHPLLQESESSPIPLSPTAMISGEELTVAAGFPEQSLPGLPVRSFAKFGREVISQERDAERKLALGKVYHMGQTEGADVHLNVDALTAHTFITGSTGAGKSNAVYRILAELHAKRIPWLVIEPAKGEYKDAFGGWKDVDVYGTNPYKAPRLLQINPFSFPDDVHVLEHIDRLVEIFNACWPMYAAMPAILRESMEKAYETCGWSLKLSKNPGVFPTFDTLLTVLPRVVASSAFSADTSSDYSGALVTRVRSLTRGIHGMIFRQDGSLDAMLPKNAIIDLSRIGSQETKSLIMGVLVLKLQEYRMSEQIGSNRELRHVTVLEEAHNLLRRTSSEQSQESSNLQGQSVAMIANAIAEMRTYGEGFVIADQSPGLMDLSVIRNTNTKVILRLPDEADRQLVGKATGLKDVQIDELAFLDRGIASVFQSGWAEPVLCNIAHFDKGKSFRERYGIDAFSWHDAEIAVPQKFLRGILMGEGQELSDTEKAVLRKWYRQWKLSENAIAIFERAIQGNRLSDNHRVVAINYAVSDILRRIYPREEAILATKRTLLGQYDFSPTDEAMHQLEELYLRVLPEHLGKVGQSITETDNEQEGQVI